MAMAIDSRQQQQPFHPMGYDAMRYPQQPQFTNPWVTTGAPAHGQMYATSLPPPPSVGPAHGDVHRYGATHAPNVSTAYTSGPIAAPSLASGIPSSSPLDPDLLDQSGLQVLQDGLSRTYGAATYAPAPPPANAYQQHHHQQQQHAAPPAHSYGNAHYGYPGGDRRPSHPSVAPTTVISPDVASLADAQLSQPSAYVDMYDRLSSATEAERQQFSDALDASRGMVAMSQSDITPRNIYGNASSRSSTDSYGFPSTHSSHSSISSASTYPSYYNSSVSEASVGDYSSASESVDMPSSRTLPRPHGLIGGAMPPGPQSMMGQFSSKVSSSSQKKHKCKICDKRFTRPSSLQTHMYSHTGEKPFACDFEGCGRHFSVVSNLRRHRKVHKGEGHDHPSPDDDE